MTNDVPLRVRDRSAVQDHEMVLRTKAGGHVTVSFTAHVVRNAAGAVIASEGIVRDISAR